MGLGEGEVATHANDLCVQNRPRLCPMITLENGGEGEGGSVITATTSFVVRVEGDSGSLPLPAGRFRLSCWGQFRTRTTHTYQSGCPPRHRLGVDKMVGERPSMESEWRVGASYVVTSHLFSSSSSSDFSIGLVFPEC